MKKLRLMIALSLGVPFAAFSANLETAAAPGDGPTSIVEDANSQYECCFILYLGKWYCVPC